MNKFVARMPHLKSYSHFWIIYLSFDRFLFPKQRETIEIRSVDARFEIQVPGLKMQINCFDRISWRKVNVIIVTSSWFYSLVL